MRFLLSFIITFTVFVNVVSGGQTAFAAAMNHAAMTDMQTMDHCVLFCLSTAVAGERMDVIGFGAAIVVLLVVVLSPWARQTTTGSFAFVEATKIRPDPRLCRLVPQRE